MVIFFVILMYWLFSNYNSFLYISYKTNRNKINFKIFRSRHLYQNKNSEALWSQNIFQFRLKLLKKFNYPNRHHFTTHLACSTNHNKRTFLQIFILLCLSCLWGSFWLVFKGFRKALSTIFSINICSAIFLHEFLLFYHTFRAFLIPILGPFCPTLQNLIFLVLVHIFPHFNSYTFGSFLTCT